MVKEQLLKHQIEQVEAAGYYVISKERVRHLHVQYAHDLDMLERMRDEEGFRKASNQQLLQELARGLGPYVLWTRSRTKTHELTRASLACVLIPTPTEDKPHEVLRPVFTLTDPFGYPA